MQTKGSYGTDWERDRERVKYRMRMRIYHSCHVQERICTMEDQDELEDQVVQGKDPKDRQVKKVLVCLGDRRREVTFCSGSGGDTKALLDAVAEVFADILGSGDNPAAQLILQTKNEDWAGEFVDAEDEIPHKSVVRAIKMGRFGEEVVGPQEESGRLTSKALSSLKRVQKPSGASAKKLAEMFPASKSVPLKRLDVFDPLEECVALPAQKKKKGSKIKPVSVKVIVLPMRASSTLPKGQKRQKLIEERRVEMIQLRRTMSPGEVRSKITCGFRHLQLTGWEYMEVNGGHLVRASNQNPGGMIVDRRGGLYIQECEATAQASGPSTSKTSVGPSTSKTSVGPSTSGTSVGPSTSRTSVGASTSGTSEGPSTSGTSEGPSTSWTSVGPSTSRTSVGPSTSETSVGPSTSGTSQTRTCNVGDPFIVSSDSDSDLPIISFTEKGKESIEETRHIRAQQDWEYQESLRIDREKDEKSRKERTRAERVQVLRAQLKDKIAAIHIQDGKKLLFRLPDGSRIDGIFSHESSSRTLYEYVFSNSSITGPFGIFSTYPRCFIKLDKVIGDIGGILTVEEGEGLIDVLSQWRVEEDVHCADDEGSTDILQQADEERIAFMQSLSLQRGLTHTIERCNIFNGVISLYKNNCEKILQENPFRIRFEGERAIDLGGVARDMFSAFYEEVYERLFDGSSLLCPIVHPEMDMSVLTTMGFVISHAYMVTGILPIRIAFPCLVQSLLGTSRTIPESAMVEAFQDSISTHESNIVKLALEEVKQQVPTFSSQVMSGLVCLLSRFNSRQIPTPEKFYRQMVNLATYEFVTKPAAALGMMYSGVPQQHRSFWDRMGVIGLLSVYRAQSVCPATVLRMIEDAEGQNATEERILGYLRQFVGNMGADELRTFLRFATGSAVCSALKIHVAFNVLSGAARRPIAHTCTPSLELSSTYATYSEFVSEFRKCIASDYSWIMDGI